MTVGPGGEGQHELSTGHQLDQYKLLDLISRGGWTSLGSATADEWRAISTRDRRSDGTFVWVALATNIYCRPSCGARRPDRRKVLVLSTASDAERRGYSACRRCRPGTTSLTSAETAVTIALHYIQNHFAEAITLRRLSRVVGLSSNHFQQFFTRIVGVSPRGYCDHCRLARLKELLRSGTSVADSVYAVGFRSIRALYERGARSLGMTPATYKRGGEGVRVRYATLDAALGRVLVASTEVGLCAVLLGDNDDVVVGEISRDLPRASLAREVAPPPLWRAAVRNCDTEDPVLSRLSLRVRREILRAKMTKALSARSGLARAAPTSILSV